MLAGGVPARATPRSAPRRARALPRCGASARRPCLAPPARFARIGEQRDHGARELGGIRNADSRADRLQDLGRVAGVLRVRAEEHRTTREDRLEHVVPSDRRPASRRRRRPRPARRAAPARPGCRAAAPRRPAAAASPSRVRLRSGLCFACTIRAISSARSRRRGASTSAAAIPRLLDLRESRERGELLARVRASRDDQRRSRRAPGRGRARAAARRRPARA